MVNPKKSLGQNFLIDKNICKKICQMATISKKNIIMLSIIITLFVSACDQNVGKRTIKETEIESLR